MSGEGRLLRPLALLTIGVVISMVAALAYFEHLSETARYRSEQISVADDVVNHLHAALLNHIADLSLGNPSTDAFEVREHEEAAHGSITDLADEATSTDYAELAATAAEVLNLDIPVDGGTLARARSRLAKAFDSFESDLHQLRSAIKSRATKAELAREIGSISALILGSLFLTLTLFFSDRSRRRRLSADLSEEAARTTGRKIESLLAASSDLVTVVDHAGLVTYQSSSIESLLGWSEKDFVGRDIRDFLDERHAAGMDALLERAKYHAEDRLSLDWRMRRSDGEMVDVEVVMTGKFDDPDIAGCVLNIRDIGERLRLEDELRHQAFHDSLTSLPNRALFEDRLGHAFERTARGGHSLCLLLADLDNFKDINDSFGHALGDAVLVEVAGRLVNCMRAEDTVVRLGGDEFAILVEEVRDEADGARAAERILTALADPITIDGVDVVAHASIGIAFASATGEDKANTDSLIAQLHIDADLAMYEAKRQGRKRYQFYSSSLQEGIRERMEMRSELETALLRGEFVLHYQPIVAIEAGVIVGAEALLRWQHPSRGLVPPLAFIPLAEQSGLIVDIGQWVLTEACREAAGWDAQMSEASAPYVTVNVAGLQLQQPGFVQGVRDVLRTTELSADRLVIEFTESALIEDTNANVLKLQELRALGVRLAIDDFGTGYSSLSYLRQFNLDILKIDKSFIDDLGRDSKGSALVAAMVAMGTSLSMEVVAEGIEEQGQMQDLLTLHCGLGQGYLFSKPIPASEFGGILSARGPSPRVGVAT